MFLRDEEIDGICEGLATNSHAAKCKRLASLGLVVNRKPNGRPLVVRSHAEAVLSGRAALGSVPAAQDQLCTATGDRAAVVALFGRKTA
ncbi:hypothetical protein [Variovorax sp. OV700]|uniref:hypothetical protein n=1 Tax=Variovorax sp. OV700 TaxID=1882826 RepID=UPI00088B133A|nr:hypothetical protein [Variovorax sp. OV700]SDI77422.1 hypothetical protein SAMN05444748_10796 [Variovorax sp. OV700]